MATSNSEIEANVLQDLIAQRDARKQEVFEDLQHQQRLRNGDYDVTSIRGMAQTGLGVVENIAQMVSGFASAIPGAAAGVGAALGARDINAYSEAFAEQADKTTYEPRSVKGKRFEGEIADAYNEYIEEKWGNEYLGGLVDSGQISPEEAAYYRTSADALLMGVFMKAGAYAKAAGTRAGRLAASRKPVNLDAAPLEGEIIPFGGAGHKPGTGQLVSLPKLLEGPKRIPKTPVGIATKQALQRDVSIGQIKEVIESAKTPEVAIQEITSLRESGVPVKITDPVFKDGIIDAEATISLLPDVATGYTRLYRASSPTVSFSDVFKPKMLEQFDPKGRVGEFYTSQISYADYFRETYGKDASLEYIDITDAEAAKARITDDIYDARNLEYIVDSKPPAPDPFTDPKNIFKNRQAGAVDLEVFVEVLEKIARPGVVTAKVAADLAHALARQVAFKHVTDIRKINSPTAKMLADRIMPTETSTIPLGGGFHELVSISEGKFSQRIDNLLEPLRRRVINRNATKTLRLIALPKEINNDIFRSLDTGVAPEYLVPVIRALRAILDDVLAYQNEAGAQVARRPNYMPHMWDAKKISIVEFGKKKGGGFTKYLMKEEGLSFDAAQEVIATITHEEGFLDFLEDAGGRLREGEDYSAWAGRTRGIEGGASRPGHAQQRSLKGEFDKAKDWLVTDVEAVLVNYINRAVRHAEYTRMAGKNEVTLNQTVRQIIEEQQVGGHRGGKLRANSPHQTAQEIYDMFDAMQGRYHQIKNPTVRRASKALAGYQVIQKLGLVTLAQFPESMMPAARYRVATATKALPGIPLPLKSYAVGIVDAAANAMSAASKIITGTRLIPKTVMRQHLERIGIISPSSLVSSASRMAGPVGTITSRVIRLFGIETITNFQRTTALDTLQSLIRENARYLGKGKENKKARMYRQELIELGLKPAEVVEWYKAGMPEDSPIHNKFDIAHVRGIDTTIIMPKAANAPRLYNDPRWQLVLEFTRFFTVFGNTVLKNIGKKLVSGDVTNTRKLASIGSLITAVGIAYYTQFMREDITGYEFRDEDDPLRMVDAFDRAGLTAMFTRLYPLFSAYRYGKGHKYIAGLLGPAASDAASFIEATGDKKRMARWMANHTPLMTITPESEDLMYEFYLELIEALPEID